MDMKIKSLGYIVFLFCFSNSHGQSILPSEKKYHDSNATEASMPRVEIQGLGNISSSQNTTGLNPSANVFIKLLPIASDSKGQARFFLGFNIGSELD